MLNIYRCAYDVLLIKSFLKLFTNKELIFDVNTVNQNFTLKLHKLIGHLL